MIATDQDLSAFVGDRARENAERPEPSDARNLFIGLAVLVGLFGLAGAAFGLFAGIAVLVYRGVVGG